MYGASDVAKFNFLFCAGLVFSMRIVDCVHCGEEFALLYYAGAHTSICAKLKIIELFLTEP